MGSIRIGHLQILLIEDDDNDIFFVEKAAKESKFVKSLNVTRDGNEALKYLRGEPPFADRKQCPMPNVVLTDINMPGMDGFGFLRWLQEHRDCRVIPVMVYSSSNLERDVKLAYELGANAYFQKPAEMQEMQELLHFLYEFWCRAECPAVPLAC